MNDIYIFNNNTLQQNTIRVDINKIRKVQKIHKPIKCLEILNEMVDIQKYRLFKRGVKYQPTQPNNRIDGLTNRQLKSHGGGGPNG